ncbi:MAG: tRNA(His) guanylyltransferase Thg1 family protein [Vulcanibacillus sp.]
MIDSLGDRMKEYEYSTRYFLPRRSYTIIRIDGKAFHTYTKGLKRPFDTGFIKDMDNTAIYLCKNIQNAKFAYVQSDEISIVLSDFDEINTEAWFGNNLQKMCSVSASMATCYFNNQRVVRHLSELDNLIGSQLTPTKWAEFDARIFQIPQLVEVHNYFVWRQQDCVRNSISSVAQSLYSAKELHKKSSSEKQEMIFKKGINWNDYDPKLKRGRGIIKTSIIKETSIRSKWESVGVPTFTSNTEFISGILTRRQV